MKNKSKQGDFRCSVEATVAMIGGKWKPVLLFHLLSGTKRYGEIRKLIPLITERMLSHQLKELESDKLIMRKAYPEVPPRVEYKLSEKGKSLVPILKLMAEWGENNIHSSR